MPSDVTSLEAERKFLRDHVLPLGKPDPAALPSVTAIVCAQRTLISTIEASHEPEARVNLCAMSGLQQADVRVRHCGLQGVSPCGRDFRNGCVAFVGKMWDLEAACTRFDWVRPQQSAIVD